MTDSVRVGGVGGFAVCWRWATLAYALTINERWWSGRGMA